MLLIFTSTISNRLSYIASLMMTEMLGVKIKLTTSADEFCSCEGPKICYAREPLADGLFIEASTLLFQSSVSLREIDFSGVAGVPLLFTTLNPVSAFRFDPFAAAFYMVSRYEEYLPHKKDRYGRYPANESIAMKGGFLEIPVVHLWAGMVETKLREYFPGLVIRYPRYKFVPTIDVDHAWCYLGRPASRTIGGFVRSLMNGRLNEISGRFKVLAGMAPDPYDNYAFINQVHEAYDDFPLFFMLFADYGANDNNVTVTSKSFHRLLRDLDQHGKVGIHPSLSSNKHEAKLENEYAGLCGVLDRKVTISRQHFLKLALPFTYHNLLKLGITDDYSMGYASHPGFRAGIAIPFPFFDLVRNDATPLMIHPVTMMDVTMKDYLRLSRVQSLEKITEMIQTIRNVNGEFVSLWHNESLGETGRWHGWRAVYQEMVKLAAT